MSVDTEADGAIKVSADACYDVISFSSNTTTHTRVSFVTVVAINRADKLEAYQRRHAGTTCYVVLVYER